MSGFFGNTSGGFGSGGGFGASNTGGFGANNNTSTGGSIFGGANNTTATSGGFGSGGFGASAGGFGAAKPATGFGAPATSGGSAFGGNTTSTTGGFGGFGAQNTASTGFGSSNTTGGGIFGAKPATTFGGGTTGGNMFGGGASTTGGFGINNAATTSSNPFASNNTVGFGASNTNTSTGFGASNTASTNSGTGSVPFQAWTEREPTGPVTSHYQSITFQEPYKNKSFEELRVEDYLQGRKFGSTNGQAGTFGASTGFGGSTFGAGNNTSSAPSGGLFGGGATNTATSGGFGGFGQQNNNTTTTSAFGSNTGGGLFGQNKPATGGLFGGGNTSSATTGGFGATTGSTGGIFGGGNTGGFGASNTNNTASTGTSLFGNNNNTQNKPAFGGFGASTTTNNTGGFGANANSGSTGGLFGNNNASSNTGGGLFGGQNTSQPASNPFGGGATNNNSGGGLFGAKPAGTSLFGGSSNTGNTGGGLFGNNSNTNTQPQQGGGLFGSSTTNTGGGGLFGGNNNANQPKPSGGLFGSSTTGATGGTSLFGGNNNSTQPTGGSSLFGGNNNSGSSLFGGNNQNKPATGSLFSGGGGATNTSTNSLFGGNNQQTGQNSGGGLFGSLGQSNNNAQPNNNSMFGSSFGGQSNNNQNQQNQLHANLTVSPYGNDQLFSSLATASTPVGPLATPLAGARPTPSKTQSLLSSTRLNSPIYTPRASAVGRNPGYGFSYSTYGTPGSAYSVSVTPQASSLLKPTGSLGSALTSRLAKSMSMSNLRAGDSTPREGESLLRPTPGSASSRYLASGNMRKLTIDRSLRHELFSPPTEQRQPEHKQLEAARENDAPALGKKVSFDEHSKQSNAEPSATNALVRTETEEEDSPSNLFRASEKTPVNGTPEMSQVNGNLHTVFEDGEQRRPASAPGIRPGEADLSKEEVGDYWTKPSIKDLKNMGRETLKKLGGIVVGRHGVGRIEFSACDLSNTDLDEICGQDNGKGIVHLKPRSATVYPNEATKPARGKGLNVPSKIFLENSWPKSHGGKKAVMANSGPAYEKHIRRLKKTGGTKFLDYDVKTGTWSFSVEHFTTYELDDSDDDETTMDMNDQQDSSGLSDAPATPGQDDDTMQSIETGETGTGEVDDTFEFKINQRSLSSAAGAHPPGAFDESHVSYDYDDPSADEDVNEDFMMSGGLGNAEEDPFASPGGAVQPPSPQTYERYHSSMIDEHSGAVQLAEEMQNDPEPELPGSFMPEERKLLRSILKPTARASAFASPQKLATETWEDQLQRTMSPQKRDRQYLREIQKSAKVMNERQEDFADTPFKRSMLGRSALGQSYLAQKSAKKVGFGASTMQIQPADMGKSQAFRTSMDIMNSLWSQEKSGKNGFATERSYENPYPKRTRLSTADDMSSQDAAFHETMKPSFASNGMLVYSVEGSTPQVSEPLATGLQPIVGEHKEVRFAKWLPAADINTRTLTAQKELTSIDLTSGFPHANTSAAAAFVGNAAISADKHEQAVWSLAGHLFDAVELLMEINDMTAEQVAEFEPRLRKDAFSALWASLVQEGLDEQLALARSPEERALLYLTKNDVPAACDALAAGKDFKLATLIAQLPGTEGSRQLMQTQITAWKDRNDWAEFSDATRALYSILAGEVCTVSGKNSTAENRAKEFCIAEKFGLSWLQSLALRTSFAGHEKLGDAFKAYFAALADGEEHVLPLPSWAANDDAADRESVLVGLLRLSTSRNNAFDPSSVFDPKTVSGSAMNSRLAWQLATQIRAKGLCSAFTDEKMDQLTLSFATELEAAGKFLTATWVLLHLRNGESRTRAVTALLFRNGGNIPEAGATPEGTIDAFHVLNAENQIHADILWSAKAQHARAEFDNAWLQCEYLLQASALDEAHDVVCTTLGPRAVIEEEYGPLKDLLDRFPAEPEGWSIGGNVFRDFASLVTMSVGKKYGFEGADVMVRLRDGLEGMSRSERTLGLEERVAIVEMGRVLQKEIGELAIRPGGIEVRGVDVRMIDDGPADVGVGAFLRYKEAMGVVA